MANPEFSNTSLVSAQLKLWGVWINYILLAVPLFVFLGELISRSNIGANLYMFLHRGVPIRGSAAYGSIGACAGFWRGVGVVHGRIADHRRRGAARNAATGL